MLVRIERHYPLYTAEQLFELVADVEKYPEFLPWILSSRILRREPNVVWVDMTLGIGPLQQRFTSQGVLYPPHAIDITSSDGPFQWFRQRWDFAAGADGQTVVGYGYDITLRSLVMDLISHLALDEAMRATIDAFEQRARVLYRARGAPGVLQDGAEAAPGVPQIGAPQTGERMPPPQSRD